MKESACPGNQSTRGVTPRRITMGRSSTAVAVNFKLEGVAYRDSHSKPESSWERVLVGLDPDGSYHKVDLPSRPLGFGWSYSFAGPNYTRHEQTVHCGKIQNIEQGLEILVINESYYDGVWHVSLFSEDLFPLEAFAEDFKYKSKIQVHACVLQTI
jgi:hypothetical protein